MGLTKNCPPGRLMPYLSDRRCGTLSAPGKQ